MKKDLQKIEEYVLEENLEQIKICILKVHDAISLDQFIPFVPRVNQIAEKAYNPIFCAHVRAFSARLLSVHRADAIREIREQFLTDYSGVDQSYQSNYAIILSLEDYKTEKQTFDKLFAAATVRKRQLIDYLNEYNFVAAQKIHDRLQKDAKTRGQALIDYDFQGLVESAHKRADDQILADKRVVATVRKHQLIDYLNEYNFEAAHKIHSRLQKDAKTLEQELVDYDWCSLLEDAKDKQREKIRIETEEKERKEEAIANIRSLLRDDFLKADHFFETTGSEFISPAEYEQIKMRFIKSWFEEHLRGGMHLPDDEQCAAIAAINGHVLVTARAGSGKTATLVNRAYFLIKHCHVPPSTMLLLAFNRKAALEVRRRLLVLLHSDAEDRVSKELAHRFRDAKTHKKKDRSEMEAAVIEAIAEELSIELPHVMTFHALAHALVHPEKGILHDNQQEGSRALSRVVQNIIDNYLKQPDSRGKIRELMLAHFKTDWARILEGGHTLSKEAFLLYRRSLPRESLNGEPVKSYGEKLIADFLFEHDTDYKYERNHWWGDLNYRPDFTVFKSKVKGKECGVIIEYFGLQGDPDYDKMSDQKRTYWAKKKNWTLVEFNPEDITVAGPESFCKKLKHTLIERGIPCQRLSEDEIWKRCEGRAIDRFTTAIAGFIGRCRKQLVSVSDLRARIGTHEVLSGVEKLFLDLACCFYEQYLQKLAATGKDDFDGLMQQAARQVSTGKTEFKRKSGRGDLSAMRYICIDEFQDFSELFHQLLCAIRKQAPKAELFCVGDDWQAINGFAGSDLRFFKNFKDYIRESRQLYISTNYRSATTIVDAGNALMDRFGKPAIAYKTAVGHTSIADLAGFKPTAIEKKRHPGDIITPVVLRIVSKALEEKRSVVLLNRTNDMYWYVYDDKKGEDRKANKVEGYQKVIRDFFPENLAGRISASTSHKYKGLQKPVVVVLDAVERRYPLVHPDWVFSRLLGESPEKIVEEERRLFYVALTRAEEEVFVITDERCRTPFLSMALSNINWDDYPPAKGEDAWITVRLNGNTLPLKEQLKLCGYIWRPKKEEWEKAVPRGEVSLGTLKAERWAPVATNIDVKVLDCAECFLRQYQISNDGSWKRIEG